MFWIDPPRPPGAPARPTAVDEPEERAPAAAVPPVRCWPWAPTDRRGSGRSPSPGGAGSTGRLARDAGAGDAHDAGGLATPALPALHLHVLRGRTQDLPGLVRRVTAALSALFPQAALLVRQVDDGDALLSAGEPATVVLVPPRDLEGRSTTGAIEALAARSQRPLLLGYVPIGRGTSPDILQLGRTSIDGLVLSHVNDGGNALRATLLAAVLRRVGADLDEALRGAFPEEALRLARLGMRSDPVATIDEGALVIRTSRRTIHKRLRARRLPAARELLEWGRLILATALLERMRWSTLEVAGILRFSSPGALRASCRRRLGRSVRTLREPGATDQVLQAFQAVADRSGRTPQARSASRPTDPR